MKRETEKNAYLIHITNFIDLVTGLEVVKCPECAHPCGVFGRQSWCEKCCFAGKHINRTIETGFTHPKEIRKKWLLIETIFIFES